MDPINLDAIDQARRQMQALLVDAFKPFTGELERRSHGLHGTR